MSFPIITDYLQAMRNATSRFATLDVRPDLDSKGAPLFFAGNFAAVFRVRLGDTDEKVALKFFTRDIPDLVKRHAVISRVTRDPKARYFVNVRMLPGEVYVNSKIADSGEYPVVVMPWIESKTLLAAIQRFCDNGNRKAMAALTRAWANLCLDMLARGIAHGDLKHDNVLLTSDGQLRLIDYDSLYAPPLKGLRSVLLGGANYQHPGRDTRHFDRTLDHFSMLVIALSLRALTFEPELFADFNTGENIIMSHPDFVSMVPTGVIRRLQQSPDALVRDWTARLFKTCRSNSIAVAGLDRILQDARTVTDAPRKSAGGGSFFLSRLFFHDAAERMSA
nr:Serine/threonine protein kinase [uncultured bacterium]